jgi:hypothetical protein
MTGDRPPLDVDDDVDDAPLARPYALTGGRTRAPAGHELPIEALVVAVPGAAVGQTPEQRQIVAACHAPISVAEVSAFVRVPVGVARVLVGDLTAAGLVSVHGAQANGSNGRPDQSLLERVLNGLQAL